MTEYEKMLDGKLYDPSDNVLVKLHERATELCSEYNCLKLSEAQRRTEIIHELLTGVDFSEIMFTYFEGPIRFSYGINTTIGEGLYANADLTILDNAPVKIGSNVAFGPNVSLLTPTHPLRYQQRNYHTWPDGRKMSLLYAMPITIGDNCWLAANVTVTGGVTIGSGSVIGAGSVVTRDIPANVLAAGVPCRVIRAITEADDVNSDLCVKEE